MTRFLIIILAWLTLVPVGLAQAPTPASFEEAMALFDDGKYADVIPLAQDFVTGEYMNLVQADPKLREFANNSK